MAARWMNGAVEYDWLRHQPLDVMWRIIDVKVATEEAQAEQEEAEAGGFKPGRSRNIKSVDALVASRLKHRRRQAQPDAEAFG